MKTYTITFKDGTSMIAATIKRVTMFNETVDLLPLQTDTLYLNAKEVRSVLVEQK